MSTLLILGIVYFGINFIIGIVGGVVFSGMGYGLFPSFLAFIACLFLGIPLAIWMLITEAWEMLR